MHEKEVDRCPVQAEAQPYSSSSTPGPNPDNIRVSSFHSRRPRAAEQDRERERRKREKKKNLKEMGRHEGRPVVGNRADYNLPLHQEQQRGMDAMHCIHVRRKKLSRSPPEIWAMVPIPSTAIPPFERCHPEQNDVALLVETAEWVRLPRYARLGSTWGE